MTITPPTEPRNDRAAARELALIMLCHADSYPADERVSAVSLLFDHPPAADEGDIGAEALARFVSDRKLRRWAEKLVTLVLEHAEAIDETIAGVSQRWKVARMSNTDRNVIRLAVAELIHVPDSPRAVLVAEAVRLATRYGSERSGPFVNGVVDQLASTLRPSADDRVGR